MKRNLALVSLPLLTLLSGLLPAQDNQNPGQDPELQRFNLALYALEDRLGYTDLALLEPLESIADQLMLEGRFTEAHATLDRAQQIARLNEGLYTKSQLRFIEKKIANFANAGDWDSARQLQDHLFWLYTRRYDGPDEPMIRGLLRAADLHLRGVTEDGYNYNGYHYRAAGMSARIALGIADTIWHPRDPRLSQILYEQIKHSYLQALAVEKGSVPLSSRSLRQQRYGQSRLVDEPDQPRSWAEERYATINMHRQNGLIYLRRLEEVFADRQDPNLEGAAMVKLYQADWEVLFHRRNSALEYYKEAYYGLMDAGVPVEQVNDLFSQPALIPESDFYATVAGSLNARNDWVDTRTLSTELDIPIRLTFSDWNAEQGEEQQYPQLESQPNVALFSFNLNPATEDPNRRRDRGFRQIGVAQNLALMEQVTDSAEQENSLLRNLHWLRFRPKLVDGVPQAVSGVISYLVASGN